MKHPYMPFQIMNACGISDEKQGLGFDAVILWALINYQELINQCSSNGTKLELSYEEKIKRLGIKPRE